MDTLTTQISEIKDLIKITLGEILSSFAIQPTIGFEIEFYLKSKPKTKYQIKEEKGEGQYEIALPPSMDIIAALHEISELQRELETYADLSPKPYTHDYGSALQVHIALQRDKKNLMDTGSCNQNQYLLNYISTLLSHVISNCHYLLTPECYDRFQPQFMAPSNVSWGINNRTTLLRVIQKQGEPRRVEFRLPSANCCPYRQAYFLLKVLQHSLTSPPTKDKLIDPTYGNAFDTQYNLEPLPKSHIAAKEYFHPQLFLL